MSRKTRKDRQKAERLPDWFGTWGRMSESRQHLVIAVILVAVTFGFFAPIHFSSRQLVGGDTISWRSMAQSMLQQGEASGSVPLWDTNAFAGMPGYLISYPPGVPQIDTVIGWFRLLIWPSSHMLLLLFGMYFFVWFLTADKRAGLLSAILFGLTSYLPEILIAGHNSKFVTLAWTPWLLLAFLYVLRKPGLMGGLLFAAATAVNLRAGHVQITYYAAFVMGVWWVGAGISAVRNQDSKSFVQSTLWLVIGGAVGLLMIAQPILAQMEYKRYSIRGAGAGGVARPGLGWTYAMGWSEGILEVYTLLIANAFGGGGATYWGPKPFTAGPHYIGTIAILFGVWTLVRNRNVATVSIGVVTGLMILFSFGENFPLINRPMFDYFPMFSTFRVPETWLSMVALCMSVLAGTGLASFLACEDETIKTDARTGMARSLYIVAGTLGAFILVPMLLQDTVLDFERPGESNQIVRQIQAQYPGVDASDPRVGQVVTEEMARRHRSRADLFQQDAGRSVIVLLLSLGLVLLFLRRRIPGWFVALGLILIAGLDLGGVGRRFINSDNLAMGADIESQVPRYGFDDFILGELKTAGGPGRFRVLSLENGQDPSINARPSFFYESLGGYHGAKLRVYQDFLDKILIDRERGGLNHRALDLMNVRFIVSRNPIPGYREVYRDETSGNNVYENPTVLPRAHFVTESRVVTDLSDLFSALQNNDFDPSRTVLLSGTPVMTDAPDPTDVTPFPDDGHDDIMNSDSSAHDVVALSSFTADRIEWQVKTSARRWLVVSEVFYPAGWNAYIDDQPVDIHQANYLIRAVEVPPGSHRVRMEFRPDADRLGTWLSAGSTVFVYGVLLWLIGISGFRRKKETIIESEALNS